MLTKDEIRELAKEGFADPVFFCKSFLPHLFPNDIPWVHRGVWSIITGQTGFLSRYGQLDKIQRNFLIERGDEDEEAKKHLEPIFVWNAERDGLILTEARYTMLMLPRGYSKTTLAGIAAPLRDILYNEVEHFLYVSEAGAHAERQLGNVKNELETNNKLKLCYGELAPSNSSSLKWTNDFCETTNGCAIHARGRGGQVRGLNWHGKRPDKVLVDDVEDLESVQTPEQRDKTQVWAYGDLLPVMPEQNPKAKMVVLGTLLHPAALMTVFQKDPQFLPVVFGALDRDGDLLWADQMDFKKIETKKMSYSILGKLDLFYLEFFNTNRGFAGKKFRPDFFKYGLPEGEYRKAIYCDPAISERPTADKATIYVVGMSPTGQIVVFEQWSKRGAEPRELIDQYFDMAKRHKPIYHGFESNGYQAALKHLLREEMFRKKYYFEPIPVTHTQKKTTRVEGILQPRFAAGYIWFACEVNELKTQLLDWGSSSRVHDDHPDGLAGAVELLDPFAAAAAGDFDLAKDEYPPLEEVVGEWRARL